MRSAIVAMLVSAVLAASPTAGTSMQTPKRGGTVVFGPVSEPPCLNPLAAACSFGLPQFSWIDKVLTPTFLTAPDSTLRPALVSRVTFTRTLPFTITYRIRPKARWSDGVHVSARDFVFTHRWIIRYAKDNLAHRQVRSIHAVDAKTVRVVLRSRVGDWRLFLFWVVVPQHALVGENLERIWTDGVENPKTGRPIGNGPFLVERWERGKQLTLVRNPRYWGPHAAYLDRLVIRFCQACTAVPSAEELSALRQGDVDFALSRDTGIVSDLRRIPGIGVHPTRSSGWEYLTFRTRSGGHPALRNKLVRRALAYGIDRVAIVRRLFGEIDRTYRPSDSAAFLNTSPHYRPNWSRYRYSPVKARRLLEQAGCRRGTDGIYVCNNQRLSLRFVTTAGGGLRQRGLELAQTQLRKVGIEARIVFTPGDALFGQVIPNGEFDAISSLFFISYTIAGKDVFGCDGYQNFSAYCQRLVTEDLDRADRILDAGQRARVLNRIDRRLARDVPVLPLYQVPWVLAYRKSIRNVVPSPFNPFWNAESWWLER